MVPISPEIYSSTAVVMDNRGLADYVARTQQRLVAQKAAKDEALDKYFTDLKMKINPAGMRTQDTPGFNQKLQAWIANGIANKNEIGKGGLAKQNHLMKFQELLADVDQSKQEAQLQEKLDEKKKNDELEEEDLPTLENVSKSIYDPLHYKNLETKTPYSMADFSFSKPAWDVAKRKQFIDYASAGVQPAGKINEKTVIDPYTGNKVTTFDKVYTQDQLRDITQKAIAISSDTGGLKTYKRLLKQGAQQIPSEEFIALAKAYNSINPDDPMDTPLKVAMADIVLGKSGVMGSGRIAEGRPSKGTTFNFGGEAGQTVRNLYDDVKALANRAAQKDLGAAMNEVPSADAQIKLIQIAQKAKNDSNLSQKNTYLKVEPDGVLWIYKVTKRDSKGGAIQGERIARVTKEDLDLPFQPGVAEERQVIAGAKKEVQKAVPVKKPVALKGVPQGGF